jgi:hypothetical protein
VGTGVDHGVIWMIVTVAVVLTILLVGAYKSR